MRVSGYFWTLQNQKAYILSIIFLSLFFFWALSLFDDLSIKSFQNLPHVQLILATRCGASSVLSQVNPSLGGGMLFCPSCWQIQGHHNIVWKVPDNQ